MVTKANFAFALLALAIVQVQPESQNSTAGSAPKNNTTAGTKTASRMDLHYGTAQAHGRTHLINVLLKTEQRCSGCLWLVCDFQRVNKVVRVEPPKLLGATLLDDGIPAGL